MENPFKFGSIVDEPYFTNRTKEIEQVSSVLNSPNHLILISPRRYGKSSLIFKVIKTIKRPVIAADLQLMTSVEDFAAQLLKRIYREFPSEKIRQLIKNFRVIPTISVNPITNAVDVSFQPTATSSFLQLEDVLNTIERLSDKKKRSIVILDEFQEAARLDSNLYRQLRTIMQHHRNINYIFLGSQESMIREIFEKKRSPFYHFGYLLTLDRITQEDFSAYLEKRLIQKADKAKNLAEGILDFTRCHPYYTQQLAFIVWEKIRETGLPGNIIEAAVNEIILTHDMDYERIWAGFNKTDKKLMVGMAESDISPLTTAFYTRYGISATSTVYSSIKRMMANGYITMENKNYVIDDPFFVLWITKKRNL